jgi:hypothetical protein
MKGLIKIKKVAYSFDHLKIVIDIFKLSSYKIYENKNPISLHSNIFTIILINFSFQLKK